MNAFLSCILLYRILIHLSSYSKRNLCEKEDFILLNSLTFLIWLRRLDLNQRPSGYEYRHKNSNQNKKLQNRRICVVFRFDIIYLIPYFFMLFYLFKGINKGMNGIKRIYSKILLQTVSYKAEFRQCYP